jgi:hypothetical protein
MKCFAIKLDCLLLAGCKDKDKILLVPFQSILEMFSANEIFRSASKW